MTKPRAFDDPAGCQLLAAIGKIRRMTSGDPTYHSGRKEKEYASPNVAFVATLATNARRMPQINEFDPGRAEAVGQAHWMEGERILNELIHGCQRSLEGLSTPRAVSKRGGGRGPMG